MFIEAKDDGGGGDNWSYRSCKAPVKSSPPTNQHPVFYRPDALPVTQPTVLKHWRENITYSMDLLAPSSPGVFQLCLWPLIAPGYLGDGCHASHYPSDLRSLHLRRLYWCFDENWRHICFGSLIRTSSCSLCGLLRPVVLEVVTWATNMA